MLISFALSLFFHFLIVNARRHQSTPSSKRALFFKGVNTPDETPLLAINSASHDPPTIPPTSVNPPAEGNPNVAPLPPIQNVDSQSNNASTQARSREPSRDDTTTCQSPSGKPVTFTDIDCWYAANVLAQEKASMSQCGNCVLGLWDVDHKRTFKPTESLNATFLQEQAINLLNQCKSNPRKVIKRDSSSTASNDGGTNIQLLMGYKAEPKSCPGL